MLKVGDKFTTTEPGFKKKSVFEVIEVLKDKIRFKDLSDNHDCAGYFPPIYSFTKEVVRDQLKDQTIMRRK